MKFRQLFSACAAIAFATTVLLPVTTAHAQGKLVSTSTFSGFTNVPIYPTSALVAGLEPPRAYKSTKNFLIVTVSMQVICSGTNFGVAAIIDGNYIPPSTSNYSFSCSDMGFHFSTLQFVLKPESQGGPAITPGSAVEIRASGQGGTVEDGQVTITIGK